MAEDLLETVGQLFGSVRGGLAYAVVFVGALLAATTGVVAASVISMGLISLPIMLRYGYDARFATGTIAASGTLAQIVPPSLVLIVMADQLGRSVGDMYTGALLPGLMLAGFYMLYVFVVSTFSRKAAPGLPPEAIGYRGPDGKRGYTSLALLTLACGSAAWLVMRDAPYTGADYVILTLGLGVGMAFVFAIASYMLHRVTNTRLLSPLGEQVVFVMVPPLLLIFLVLGTIFIGVATPTEGGAMGAVGAMLLAFAKRVADRKPQRFNLGIVRSAAQSTAKLSAFVMFILVGARVFSLTFYGVNGHKWVEHLLVSLPGGEVGFLVFVNILVFFLAFFLDFFELAFIIIPLLAPAAAALGIDLIWFGVILAVNMQTSFMHPPVRVRALLSALGGAAFKLRRQGDGALHAARHDGPDLLGGGAVRPHPVRDGGAADRLSGARAPRQGADARRSPGAHRGTATKRAGQRGPDRAATVSACDPRRPAARRERSRRARARLLRAAGDFARAVEPPPPTRRGGDGKAAFFSNLPPIGYPQSFGTPPYWALLAFVRASYAW